MAKWALVVTNLQCHELVHVLFPFSTETRSVEESLHEAVLGRA
jgi:hypothetical protein